MLKVKRLRAQLKTFSGCISEPTFCAELDSFMRSLTTLHNQLNGSLFLNHVFCLRPHLLFCFRFDCSQTTVCRCDITGAPLLSWGGQACSVEESCLQKSEKHQRAAKLVFSVNKSTVKNTSLT